MLVTGGAGFVGSHLCDSLVDDGHDVVCYDNLSTGRPENVSHLEGRDRFAFVPGDVTDDLTSRLSRAACPPPEDVSRVYHLASPASPADFESAAVEIALTNSVGTRNVLQFARAYDARVVHASTSEVYGDPTVHPQSEEYNGNVDIRGDRACYNVSKRFSEMLAKTFRHRHDIDVRTVRIFNTYGPRMRLHDGRVIPTFVRQALSGDDLTVYGDGSQTRCFLYVDDLVRAMRALMARPDLSGEVVNVGSVREIDIETLAHLVTSILDADVGVTYEPLPHEDDPKRRKPDITKAQQLLDWSPTISLESGLKQTIPYFRKQSVPRAN